MGLFARDDEVPYWIHAWDFISGVLVLWLPMIGAGIFCLAVGNTLARGIGAALVIGGAMWGLAAIREIRSRRSKA